MIFSKMSTHSSYLVIWALVFGSSLIGSGRAKDAAWEDIESELTARGSPSNSAAENLELVLELLAEKKSESDHSGGLIVPIKRRIMFRLELIHELQEKIDLSICDEVSYYTRDVLVEKVSRYIEYPLTQGIILHQAYELAKVCQKQNAIMFKREIEYQRSFPSEGFREYSNYIRPFFAKVIYATIIQDESSLEAEDYNVRLSYDNLLGLVIDNPDTLREIYSQFIFSHPWTHGIEAQVGKAALHSIMSLIKRATIEDREEIERIRIEQEDGVEFELPATFFHELIMGNCRKFVAGIGEELFRRAQKDVRYLGNSIIEERSKTIADYYFSWASYRACWSLIHDAHLEFHMKFQISQQADLLGERTGHHPNEINLLIHEDPKYQRARRTRTT